MTPELMRKFLTDAETFNDLKNKELLQWMFWFLEKDTMDCLKVNLVEKLMASCTVSENTVQWNWTQLDTLVNKKDDEARAVKLPYFSVHNAMTIEAGVRKLLTCLESEQELSKLFRNQGSHSAEMNIEKPCQERVDELIDALRKSKAWLKGLRANRNWTNLEKPALTIQQHEI